MFVLLLVFLMQLTYKYSMIRVIFITFLLYGCSSTITKYNLEDVQIPVLEVKLNFDIDSLEIENCKINRIRCENE